MSLILKGIDLPSKEKKSTIIEIYWDGDVWVDDRDRYECKGKSAIQIDDEKLWDRILRKVARV